MFDVLKWNILLNKKQKDFSIREKDKNTLIILLIHLKNFFEHLDKHLIIDQQKSIQVHEDFLEQVHLDLLLLMMMNHEKTIDFLVLLMKIDFHSIKLFDVTK